jgi:cytochrome c oxidase subunit 4
MSEVTQTPTTEVTEAPEHAAADGHAVAAHDEHAGHPSEKQYVIVALILAVVTAVEVGLYYVELAKLPLVLALLVLATIKFAMVAMFFMHLKFDNRLFRRLFVVGIILALSVYTVVLLTFHVFISDRSVDDTRLNPPQGEGAT